ncbi:SDR family NAD(P)-dependent oxidoreductase [Limosilactobacillus antri]|uniref:Oxidoreductase, short chain dehydrogenase/reductase family protein n=1 Tax=Limosilactobacillus antri DSM 16041 TaxID=525309 RepID=C8P8F2_9LACO|nr:SDR family NAD(P)-dependent oxidoreductase [Limosilactobacillus antri]EEW53250.1 oxidoreductase, short chain dehydrogenase/reductase family protein [Limosilactobacillus antri DSM 16041]KRK57915.1 hypothetical protein FC31_GL001005 [Limosilactobacillus antri DSM 16041]
MSVAVITGATSGLGREYVNAVMDECPKVDEIWLIARRKKRMEKIQATYPQMNFRIIELDLAQDESYLKFAEILRQKQPRISAVIANAGVAYNGDVFDMSEKQIRMMIDLNVKGTTIFVRECLRYMVRGSFVLLVSSVSSFVPNPDLAVYSSTKFYVTSFGLALREELKNRQINVCTAMPGMMKTEMVDKLSRTVRSSTFNLVPSLNVPKFAHKTIKAAQSGKASYTMLAFYKAYRVVAKLVPHRLLIRFTKI